MKQTPSQFSASQQNLHANNTFGGNVTVKRTNVVKNISGNGLERIKMNKAKQFAPPQQQKKTVQLTEESYNKIQKNLYAAIVTKACEIFGSRFESHGVPKERTQELKKRWWSSVQEEISNQNYDYDSLMKSDLVGESLPEFASNAEKKVIETKVFNFPNLGPYQVTLDEINEELPKLSDEEVSDSDLRKGCLLEDVCDDETDDYILCQYETIDYDRKNNRYHGNLGRMMGYINGKDYVLGDCKADFFVPGSQNRHTIVNGKLDIHNIVATVNLGQEINITQLVKKLKNCEYQVSKSIPQCLIRREDPKSNCAVFATGNMTINGITNPIEVKKAARMFIRMIQLADNPDVRLKSFRIDNISANYNVGTRLRLDGFSLEIPDDHWYTDDGGSIRYEMKKTNTKLAIHSTGVIEVKASRDCNDALTSISIVEEHLKFLHAE